MRSDIDIDGFPSGWARTEDGSLRLPKDREVWEFIGHGLGDVSDWDSNLSMIGWRPFKFADMVVDFNVFDFVDECRYITSSRVRFEFDNDVDGRYAGYVETENAWFHKMQGSWYVLAHLDLTLRPNDKLRVMRRDGRIVDVRLSQEIPYKSSNVKTQRWSFDTIERSS